MKKILLFFMFAFNTISNAQTFELGANLGNLMNASASFNYKFLKLGFGYYHKPKDFNAPYLYLDCAHKGAYIGGHYGLYDNPWYGYLRYAKEYGVQIGYTHKLVNIELGRCIGVINFPYYSLVYKDVIKSTNYITIGLHYEFKK